MVKQPSLTPSNLIVQRPEDMEAVAEIILRHFSSQRVFTLSGNLGTGKTTLVKAMCKRLGVADSVTSPTFSIVNEYHADRITVYHFDLYRLNRMEELFDLGYEIYFNDQNAWCFIEWPKLIGNLLPHNSVNIHLEIGNGGERQIHFKPIL